MNDARARFIAQLLARALDLDNAVRAMLLVGRYLDRLAQRLPDPPRPVFAKPAPKTFH